MITPCNTETQINLRTAGSCCTGAMRVTPRKTTPTRSRKCVSTADGNSDQTMLTPTQRGTDVWREPQQGVHYRTERQQQVEATKRSGLQ